MYPSIGFTDENLVALFKAAGFPAATRVPATRKDGMVRAGRIGGDRPTGITDRPSVLVECWHTDPVKAGQLGRDLHDALYAARNGIHAGWHLKEIDAAGPYAYDDPNAPGMTRMQFTASLLVRLAA